MPPPWHPKHFFNSLLVRRMEAGFDDADAGQATAGLAPDWVHAEHSELDRTTLRHYIAYEALNEREPETKTYRNRVDVTEDDLAVRVDGECAELECTARFSRLSNGEREETWVARVHAELEKREDGWTIVRSRHVDLAGKGPR
jgi:hypothetical protein